jgi:hypothetical protein
MQGAVEEYVPDEAAVKDRDSHRQRLIAKVFRPLKDDAERALTKETGA